MKATALAFMLMFIFICPLPAQLTLAIYDILGRKVETLTETYQPAGFYRQTWDADSRTSGVYFVKMTSGNYSNTRKIVLLK